MSSSGLADRARQELAAAQLLADNGFAAQAVSRAYYAALYAGEAALLDLGETRSRHSGVIAAFVRLVVGEGGADPSTGRLLRSLFDRRAEADYSPEDVPADEATLAVADANVVLDAVERWFRVRGHR